MDLINPVNAANNKWISKSLGMISKPKRILQRRFKMRLFIPNKNILSQKVKKEIKWIHKQMQVKALSLKSNLKNHKNKGMGNLINRKLKRSSR